MNHLIGEWFVVDVDGSLSRTGELTAVSIAAADPVITDGWTRTGEKKQQKSTKLSPQGGVPEQRKSNVIAACDERKDSVKAAYEQRKRNVRDTVEGPISIGADLPSESPVNNNQSTVTNHQYTNDLIAKDVGFVYAPSVVLTVEEADAMSSPADVASPDVQDVEIAAGECRAVMKRISGAGSVFKHRQRPGESDGDYHDRVIDEVW
jgi:hypothetical protein